MWSKEAGPFTFNQKPRDCLAEGDYVKDGDPAILLTRNMLGGGTLMKLWGTFCSVLALGLVWAVSTSPTYAAAAAAVTPQKSAAPAVAAAPAVNKPIASTDGEASGTHIDVLQLKRVGGDTLMLKFVVHNDSETAINHDTFYGAHGDTVDGVYLVDLAGKKKYNVVTDAATVCVCSSGFSDIAPHSSLLLWAKFPAPQDSVTKIGVVMPHFVPMDDVPISP